MAGNSSRRRGYAQPWVNPFTPRIASPFGRRRKPPFRIDPSDAIRDMKLRGRYQRYFRPSN